MQGQSQLASRNLTPELFAQSEAKKMRARRIEEAARRVGPPAVKSRPYKPSVVFEAPPAEPAREPETVEQWVERQKRIPLPGKMKPLWFSIVGESEPDEPVEMKFMSVELIQRIVAREAGFTRAEFLSQRRTQDVVRARQIAMYLAKILTAKSLPDIGRRFGGRDHTTVLHAVTKWDAKIKTDTRAAKDVAYLEALIKEAIS